MTKRSASSSETSRELVSLSPRPSNDHGQRGPLVAIGGAEDKAGDRAILAQVAALAGGKGAKIALFPTASEIPDQMERLYRGIFESMGVEVRAMWIRERSDAADPKILKLLDGITGVFFTGGAQGRIVSLLGGTPLTQVLRRAHRDGVLVAGTSAGASVICQHMIAQGRAGYTPRRQSVTLAPGLGLTRRLVIDQHFGQRHRIGRLFSAVAMNPFLIGVGIDEDTAIVLNDVNVMQVIGRGTVTVVEGSRLQHTNIHEIAHNAPATIAGLDVSVLTAGHGYDVDKRRSRWPGQPDPSGAAHADAVASPMVPDDAALQEDEL